MRWRRAALAEILPAGAAGGRPIGSEQSNTSVVYDRRAILKLFRHLEAGPSPELELTDFLTRQAAFPGAPRLAGAVTYQADGAEPVTLAVLHEFVPNQGDAWTATLERLAEYYAAAIEGRGEESPDPVFARALAAADAHEAARLGALTGRLHRALASAPPGHALAPEPIDGGRRGRLGGRDAGAARPRQRRARRRAPELPPRRSARSRSASSPTAPAWATSCALGTPSRPRAS